MNREEAWRIAWKAQVTVVVLTGSERWERVLKNAEAPLLFNVARLTTTQCHSHQWLESNKFRRVA
jgi:hypothetical protein